MRFSTLIAVKFEKGDKWLLLSRSHAIFLHFNELRLLRQEQFSILSAK